MFFYMVKNIQYRKTRMTLNLLYSLPTVLQARVYEYDDTYREKLNEIVLLETDTIVHSNVFQLAKIFHAFAHNPKLFEYEFRRLLYMAMDNFMYLSMDSAVEPDDWTNGLVSYSQDWKPHFSRVNPEVVKFKLLPVDSSTETQIDEYDGFMSMYEQDNSPVPNAQYFGHCIWFIVA
jgi:hypothetical protein